MTKKHISLHFGDHFMLDGVGGSKEKLNSKELVLECLRDLPAKLSMHLLSKPEVYFAAPDPDNTKDPSGGWTGMVVIKESHISIHTFPARRFVTIDVYTCKNGMDTDFIRQYFVDVFELDPKKTETYFIERGKNYPLEDIN